MSINCQKINDQLSVACQLNAQDMAAVAQAGFKSVIINRPDGEAGPQQPLSQDVMQAARAQGMQVCYQPVVSGAITTDNVVEFARLLKELPGPILAYCRTGARCAQLFEKSQVL